MSANNSHDIERSSFLSGPTSARLWPKEISGNKACCFRLRAKSQVRRKHRPRLSDDGLSLGHRAWKLAV
jgi:hypothetical protein